jgi:broad specificity phosphatase PhoE
MYHKKIHETGIIVDPETGHFFYDHEFQPLKLNFELLFVRHGETYGNCGQSTSDGRIDEQLVMQGIKNKNYRIFQGNVDTAINQLTQTGQQQAEDAAMLLRRNYLANGWIPDIIYHSPLQRARETGMPFVQQHYLQKKYFPLQDIREMSFGSWENRRICDFKPDAPCHSLYRNQNALIKDMENHCRAENFYDVLSRAYFVLSGLNHIHPGKHIILFSHSMFGAACCILTGHGKKIENGNYLVFDGKRSNGDYYIMPHATPYLIR